jgi:hypothetical protein
MLEVKIIMDSSVEDVIAFKCCSLPDQNLEIHLRNTGDRALAIPSFFVLENDAEQKKIDNVYPPGGIRVAPGEFTAIYCPMDPTEWARYRTIVFSDSDGCSYRFPTRPEQPERLRRSGWGS